MAAFATRSRAFWRVLRGGSTASEATYFLDSVSRERVMMIYSPPVSLHRVVDKTLPDTQFRNRAT
jgi:hypothetical protein